MAALDEALESWGLRPQVLAPGDEFFDRATRLNDDPPAFAVDAFLTPEECAEIIRSAQEQRLSGAAEADLYLNYRVNQEVDGGDGQSGEAAALIEDQNLSRDQLSAGASSGFRLQLSRLGAQLERCHEEGDDALGRRLLRLLGLADRRLRFAEDPWIRPDRLYVVVRDVTAVHYLPGEGVAPHVDGKDVTVLIYLNDVAEGCGGRTVFPEDGFASTPVLGRALVYHSKQRLLHYSEALRAEGGEKWVMQLLVDFRHNDLSSEPFVDYRTGQVVRSMPATQPPPR